jgi:hypothetical protein
MTQSIRRSAEAEAEHCRCLGSELANAPERALILDIAQAFDELADSRLEFTSARLPERPAQTQYQRSRPTHCR